VLTREKDESARLVELRVKGRAGAHGKNELFPRPAWRG